MATPPDAQAPPSAEASTDAATVVTDRRRQRRILAAMCLALVAVVASVSGLNVAQQDLAVDLGASQSTLLWIINGYTLALAALLMPIGAVGDRWGRKPVLVAGLVLFAATSVMAALSTTASMMLVARVGAGVAAAMIMPVTLSVITSSFPAEERARGIGIWAGFAGAGGIIGLFASSFLIDYFTWPWLFAVPVALALGALALTLTSVGNSREDHEGRFDVVGSVLSILGIGGLVLAIHEGPEQGWSYGLTVAGLVVGLVGLVAFIAWELRQDHPLFDVRLFADRGLAAGSLTLFTLFAVMFGLFLVLIQYLQAVLGYSALTAAAGLLPMAALMMPLSTLSPRIAERVGTRRMLLTGLGVFTVGLVLLATMASVDGGYLSVLPGLMVLGVGMGLGMTTSTSAITESMPVEKQGVASALNDTVREVGGALGVALLGSVLNSGYQSSVAEATAGLPAQVAAPVEDGIGQALGVAGQLGEQGAALATAAREAFVTGWHSAMWVAAAVAGASFLYVLVRGPKAGDEDEALEVHLLDGAGRPVPALAEAD
jgi:EmrB/QacA subfamily drug resistance transporter